MLNTGHSRTLKPRHLEYFISAVDLFKQCVIRRTVNYAQNICLSWLHPKSHHWILAIMEKKHKKLMGAIEKITQIMMAQHKKG
ncbi:hypothetical protein XELAEV_18041553mg [Xenopus laevis]|uniref:Uncharacterized protein n=1 Tax=Xenopus laevis TaxID=8355 RepID=A0A974H567_XENLA|nr:hypothetical protein XELAEV_18041553mg [Xenopus laevis]